MKKIGPRFQSTPQPKFYDGIWVGKINNIGYVVFDPNIANLYNELGEIVLWVMKELRWKYFNKEIARTELMKNLRAVNLSADERILVTKRYWYWRCEGQGSCQDSFIRLRNEQENIRFQREKKLEEIHEYQSYHYEDEDEDEDGYYDDDE